MGELRLCEEITGAKENSDVLLNLITKFSPLLKKYAAMLRYEDAYADLQLDFIEMICKFNMDKMKRTDNFTLLSYIKKVIYNSYIKYSKIHRGYCVNNYLFSEMSEEQFAVVSVLYSTTDDHDAYKFIEYQKYLTQQEFEVILMIYYYGYEVSEISKLKHVSRQAVNQVKVRALSKLHKQLNDTVNKVKKEKEMPNTAWGGHNERNN